jgi:diacylglycerol kinase family enzyme
MQSSDAVTSARDLRTVHRRERLLAFGSLACGLLLAVGLVIVVARNLAFLVVALLGLTLVVSGLWWTVTERMPRRAVGIASGVAGVGLIVLAIFRASPHADRPLVRIALFAVLLVGAVGCGRAALRRDLQEHDRCQPASVKRPVRPVLICNPWSGGGKVAKFDLVHLAQDLGVDVVMLDHGLDLGQLARHAIARGADCLGMAGGDGSQALVASIAVEHDLPFVCVSAGTRNHFALDLGIDREDPRRSLSAFHDGIERRIDYATVGDRLFVNNVSLGIYATIVQQEGYREAKSETTRAMLPELLGRTEQPFDLQFTEPNGADVDGAFLIQVSNNPYVLGATLDASQRRRLDTGRLGIVAISARTGGEAALVFALSALGQRRRSRCWHEFTAERFEVRSRSGTVFAGIDGEALELPTPLTFRIHPRGLRLLVPDENLTAAERRRARDISVGEVVAIARGIDPVAHAVSKHAPSP